jgi:C-terminal processing protease CtpA/Prc
VFKRAIGLSLPGGRLVQVVSESVRVLTTKTKKVTNMVGTFLSEDSNGFLIIIRRHSIIVKLKGLHKFIMKRLFSYIKPFSILILVGLLFGCEEQPKKDAVVGKKYAPYLLKEDFGQLVRVIQKNHPALYDFTPKQAYDLLIKQQSKKITDSLTGSEFYQIISPLITKIGCGHSAIYFPESFWRDTATAVLPLKVFIEKDRAYIVKNDSNEERLKAGTEILSINNKDIQPLVQDLKTYISTDGDNATTKKDRLNLYEFNNLLGVHEGFPHNYTIRFKDIDTDSILQTSVDAYKTDNLYRQAKKADSALNFTIDPTKSIATITIKTFGFYKQLNKFKQFVDKCFLEIKQKNIQHIILDLRDNSGGDPFCTSYLLSYLAHEPVPYFAKPYATYEELAKSVPLAKNHFSGKLYTLINGICFSSTAHLCALLKYHHIGEFIGTETGGTYTCNDDSQTFRLINTGLLVRVAQNTFTTAVKGLPRFKGIMPDYKKETSIEDVLKGRDMVKEFAISKCLVK